MMKTALLLAGLALAATVLVTPAAQADPMYGCVSNDKYVPYKVCYLVTDDCVAVGFRVAGQAEGEGNCT
jgi:hypothetical protein